MTHSFFSASEKRFFVGNSFLSLMSDLCVCCFSLLPESEQKAEVLLAFAENYKHGLPLSRFEFHAVNQKHRGNQHNHRLLLTAGLAVFSVFISLFVIRFNKKVGENSLGVPPRGKSVKLQFLHKRFCTFCRAKRKKKTSQKPCFT